MAQERAGLPFTCLAWYEWPRPNFPLLAGLAVQFLTKFIPVSNPILTGLLYNTLA